MEKHKTILPRLLAGVGLFALSAIQCNNAICEDLRDELYQLKLDWGRCDSDDDCIKIPGNPGDCTGVLTCDLAINKANRINAERRILSLPEETVDCVQCVSPNCPAGNITVCEQRTGQCIIVTEVIPAGETASSDAIPSETAASETTQ